MKVLVILGHPEKNSFNHAMFERICHTLAAHGHEVLAHDLYQEGFDPAIQAGETSRQAVLPEFIIEHCRDLTQAQGIIIVHPNWWGQPPAMLKGWIDRVIRPGVAYEFVGDDSGEGVPNGLLKASFALVVNTTNTDPVREQKIFGDPLERIWKDCIFGLCGVRNFHRRSIGIIVTSTPVQRNIWLDEVEKLVLELVAAK